MNTIYVKNASYIPFHYTGKIVLQQEECTAYYADGEIHREDGPASEYPSGEKRWCLNDEIYCEWIVAKTSKEIYKYYYLHSDTTTTAFTLSELEDLILLDESIGEYNIRWRRYLLSNGDIGELPVIPGMFEDD